MFLTVGADAMRCATLCLPACLVWSGSHLSPTVGGHAAPPSASHKNRSVVTGYRSL
ncbi:hypothetical protein GGTG_13821 [Gaeumannomyces tritici R3-111a-1]|uniref:Uncharacterized protein n=1 Tax=Gaeumannomyces tritici (strain R3-111a-1) TaxID=644352 RepID=J3PJY0_GAET3|nr:hypothetical protein GGTG_13821 [Gaeumannomyces tritici R3-111a-1]EJT68610.1 hypothetical protein GGTG_13821 [Gaeumannomyces tritici R3-111a-1]